MNINNYPKFHVYGPKGWINDPNGLIFYKNQYHVFYQHYPNDVHWGPMHWGHAISDDLRHWKYLEPALYPDSQDDGCFSGSAIEVNGKLYLIYTSFTNRDGIIRQQQAIALSNDGIHFEKKGFIIESNQIPEGYSKEDFRDPSVIKVNDEYVMYVAGKKVDGCGRILVFKSTDLFHWIFDKDLFGKDCIGTMIECPDKFEKVLTFSEQFFPVDIDGNNNIHASRYIIENENGKYEYKNAKALDYGFDFYAAQSFKGKYIMMAWMSMWDRSNPSEEYGFAGEITYPRVLDIKEDELIQKPYLLEDDKFDEINLDSKNEFECKTGIVRLTVKGLKSLNIKFNKTENQYAKLDLIGNELVFDRSKCKEISFKENDINSINKIRRIPFNLELTTHEFYFVLDNNSVEIFADGKVLSSLVYTEDKIGLLELNIEAESKKCEILKI